MIQVDASLFIILCEMLALLTVLICLVCFSGFRRRNRLKKAVSALVGQIKQQSKTRTQETGSFLKDIYQLDDNEVKATVKIIDKQEKKFFQKLVDVIGFNDVGKITSIDADLAALIDTYKNLKPKVPESKDDEIEKLNRENESLNKENEDLKNELATTKQTMGDMIGEFGNMFGGGADHELAKHEVVGQVKPKEDESPTENVAAE